MEDVVASNVRLEREKKGLTQEEMAQALDMSRQTYINKEKGVGELTVREVNKIAEILGMEAVDFYVRPRDDRKFEQMLLYFIQKYPEGVPKTKLAKLLYLADFYCYYWTTNPMSGVQYIKQDYGPVADVFFQLLDELYDCHVLNIKPVRRALIVEPMGEVINENLLSEDDRRIMDKIDDYWHMRKTQEIVDFTHNQHPWMTSLNKEKIPYYSIIQEDPDHVYAPGLE